MKKFISLFYAIMLTLLVSFIVAPLIDASTAQVLTGIVCTSVILAVIGVKFPEHSLFSSISVTELTNVLGAYFRKEKQTIFSNMLLGFDPSRNFEVWDDCKDEIPMPTLNTTELIKPANDTTFAPTANALAFGARIGKVRRAKVDLLLVPAVLEKTWLGKYKQKGSDAYQMPFEQYVTQQISKQIANDIRLKAVFKGVYNSAGTTAPAVMDGMLTVVAADILAGDLIPTVTGAIIEATVLAQLLKVHDDLDETAKAVPTQMFVKPTIFDWLTRKFSPVINASLVSTDVNAMASRPLLNEFPLPGTNCTVVREPGFGTSGRVVCTLKENTVYMTDTIGEENNIKIQEFERTMKLMVDFKLGFQFKSVENGILAVNDQA